MSPSQPLTFKGVLPRQHLLNREKRGPGVNDTNPFRKSLSFKQGAFSSKGPGSARGQGSRATLDHNVVGKFVYVSRQHTCDAFGERLSCQSQLAEEQHEQIFLLNIGFLNLQCYFGEAICTGLFRTDFLHGFLHGFSARIFCTDFLHGFFARIFCTDFLHGFFCTVFCPIFLRGFLRELFARIVCTDVARIFARIFRGVPKHLLGSAKISPRKSPGKFTMFWGPSGEGLGRQEGEVRLWPA